MIKLILVIILLPILVVGAVVLFTPWLDELIVNNIPRSQDPSERNYETREVTFEGGETGITLAGELTMPNTGGPFPAMIMISGSGPQDRNEQIMGHRPFLVFSDYMTKRRFAVLRYDDRGVAQSTGEHDTATTVDFADDAAAAFRWLQEQENITLQKSALQATPREATSRRLPHSRSTRIFWFYLWGQHNRLPKQRWSSPLIWRWRMAKTKPRSQE